MDIIVTNAPDRQRYEAHAGDDLVGFTEYTLGDGVVVLTHTEVLPEYEGEGIGSTLVREVLADIRRQGRKVVPLCPFVAKYIAEHADSYGDLVAPAPA